MAHHTRGDVFQRCEGSITLGWIAVLLVGARRLVAAACAHRGSCGYSGGGGPDPESSLQCPGNTTDSRSPYSSLSDLRRVEAQRAGRDSDKPVPLPSFLCQSRLFHNGTGPQCHPPRPRCSSQWEPLPAIAYFISSAASRGSAANWGAREADTNLVYDGGKGPDRGDGGGLNAWHTTICAAPPQDRGHLLTHVYPSDIQPLCKGPGHVRTVDLSLRPALAFPGVISECLDSFSACIYLCASVFCH